MALVTEVIGVSASFGREVGDILVSRIPTRLMRIRWTDERIGHWRSLTQLELAVVEYIAWFNNDRLHESLGDVSPVEFEDLYVDQWVQPCNLS